MNSTPRKKLICSPETCLIFFCRTIAYPQSRLLKSARNAKKILSLVSVTWQFWQVLVISKAGSSSDMRKSPLMLRRMPAKATAMPTAWIRLMVTPLRQQSRRKTKRGPEMLIELMRGKESTQCMAAQTNCCMRKRLLRMRRYLKSWAFLKLSPMPRQLPMAICVKKMHNPRAKLVWKGEKPCWLTQSRPNGKSRLAKETSKIAKFSSPSRPVNLPTTPRKISRFLLYCMSIIFIQNLITGPSESNHLKCQQFLRASLRSIPSLATNKNFSFGPFLIDISLRFSSSLSTTISNRSFLSTFASCSWSGRGCSRRKSDSMICWYKAMACLMKPG